MNTSLTAYIAFITFGTIVFLLWLIWVTKRQASDTPEGDSMGHAFDGIEELNNPLPKWWLYLFYITIVYAVAYLAYYNFGWKGLSAYIGWSDEGGWTSISQLEHEQKVHDDKFGDIFRNFAAQDLETLIDDPKAMSMGAQIFENNCSLCHGTDAKGSYGFPNLTDNDWLFGGNAKAIKISVAEGRGREYAMPSLGPTLGEKGVEQVSNYVLSLSGAEHDAEKAQAGAEIFAGFCVACHGTDGKGNYDVGAPNLTDNIWLFNDTDLPLIENVKFTVRAGRAGVMPAWTDILGEEKVHLVSAYVYSLSKQ